MERRAAQRFDLNLPVSVRLATVGREGCGFTQNLSARGALFHTDLPMAEADTMEITLVMPSEITLAENMRVRCRGKVRRVLSSAVGRGWVVAVQFEGYEFLPEPAAPVIERFSGTQDGDSSDDLDVAARPLRPRTAPLA